MSLTGPCDSQVLANSAPHSIIHELVDIHARQSKLKGMGQSRRKSAVAPQANVRQGFPVAPKPVKGINVGTKELREL